MATDPTKYFNQTHLMNVCHGDAQLVSDLLDRSVEALSSNLSSLTAAMDQNDVIMFISELHRIKGALGIIEKDSLFNKATIMEQRLRQDPSTFNQSDSAEFASELEILLAEISHFLDQHKR